MNPAESQFDPDRDHPGAFTVRVGGAAQSYVDLNDPRRLPFEYMQWIADTVDLLAPAGSRLRTVHVGGAGMTLARYICHTRPTSAQIVLEPDADLTEQVRRRLPLPDKSGIKVRDTDGRRGVAAMRNDSVEVVISDAFIGGRVPSELSTAEYFADVARVLDANGTMIVNVSDRAPFDYSRRVVAGLATAFDQQAVITEPPILKGRRFGNLVLLGSRVRLPLSELRAAGARAAFRYGLLDSADLRRWWANALPFTDADPGSGPDLVGFFRR